MTDHRLSFEEIERAATTIDPTFLHSPHFSAPALNAALGCDVRLKLELFNPVRCFKGRGADFFVQSLGPSAEPLVCASAGNFGAAKHRAREVCAREGLRMVEDGREVAISEGAGSIAVELLREAEHEVILVPLGNGALLGGMGRWIQAHAPGVEVWGVSAQGAASMADPWRAGPGRPCVQSTSVHTIADGVAIREPIPEAVADLHGLVHEILLVPEESILSALRLCHRELGLGLEPAGALALAAPLCAPERLGGRRVTAVVTGSNLNPQDVARWLGAC